MVRAAVKGGPPALADGARSCQFRRRAQQLTSPSAAAKHHSFLQPPVSSQSDSHVSCSPSVTCLCCLLYTFYCNFVSLPFLLQILAILTLRYCPFHLPAINLRSFSLISDCAPLSLCSPSLLYSSFCSIFHVSLARLYILYVLFSRPLPYRHNQLNVFLSGSCLTFSQTA